MPMLAEISARWSPRAFDKREPTDAELLEVFEAARWAMSCFNDQPWVYIVTRCSDGALHDDAVAGLVEFNRSWAAAAPVLGYSLTRPSFAASGQPNKHAWHDVGAASAIMSIQATHLGMMVHQMAGILPDVVRERFKVPSELEVVAGFAMGWPGDAEQLPEPLRSRERAPRERKPLSSMMMRKRFE
jgi:nitroreductase